MRLEKDLKISGFWAPHSLSELKAAYWWIAGMSRALTGGFLTFLYLGVARPLIRAPTAGRAGRGVERSLTAEGCTWKECLLTPGIAACCLPSKGSIWANSRHLS